MRLELPRQKLLISIGIRVLYCAIMTDGSFLKVRNVTTNISALEVR